MTKTDRNKVLQTILIAILGLIVINLPSLILSDIVTTQKADAQYMFHCEVENAYGQVFWAERPNLYAARTAAMHLCQVNTPFGVVCLALGCY